MQKAVVENGVTQYVDLTSEEEAKVAARIKVGEEAERKEDERQAKVEQAKAKVIAKDQDLARALGWIE